MSDLSSHWIDLPFWALNLKAPLSIEAQGPAPHPEIALLHRSRAALRHGVAVDLYQGTNKPSPERGRIPLWDSGASSLLRQGNVTPRLRQTCLPEDQFTDQTPGTVHS
ncbi:MAG: hypothetical protein R3C11_17110 [Planctomycetaceae bacterium]